MTEASPRRPGQVIFLVVMIAALALDLASKEWIFGRLGMPHPEKRIWLVPSMLSIETSLNPGALFGMGAGWGPLFIGLSVVAMLGIGYWVWRGGAAADRLLCFALGFVSGGILGNLYDRLGLPGLTGIRGERIYTVRAVRDFIHFQYNWFDWPIFNLADSFLVCGVGLLIFHAYVWEPRRKKAKHGAEAVASESARD
jgi:signal peptidase II